MSMRSYRTRRKGEYVCTCLAYHFPHRFGGGRCSGSHLVDAQWENDYGTGSCRTCGCYNDRGEQPYCEVYEGLERVKECPM